MNLMGHEDIKTTQRYLHHAMGIISATNNCSHIDNIGIAL
jgi:site-specific recombinase XerD